MRDDHESLYKNADFPIGVAISTELLLTNDRYREITIKQFNRILRRESMALRKGTSISGYL